MNTTILLCNCYQLDSNYNHTVDFNSRESQFNWFTIHTVHTLSNNMYQRKQENEIRVDKSLTELNSCNYVVITNLDDGTRYYYFIIDKQYVNDFTTSLFLQLDLIQTYLFDINFKSCLVDRQHVKRWDESNGSKRPVSIYAQEDEGLELGEYQIKKRTVLYDYTNKGSHIIVSSEPLGVVDSEPPHPVTPSDNNYENGYLNADGLRMIKALEGFASEPYQDSEGYWTTGYGITQANHEDLYNSLLPSCTEEQASEVFGDFAYNNFSKIIYDDLNEDGYNWEYMTQDLFNAMVSFAWNSGARAMKYNWTELWNSILNGDNINNPSNLQTIWRETNIMVGSPSEEGLRNRRLTESKVALGQFDYSEFIISNVTVGGTVTDNMGYGYIPTMYL